MTRIYDEDDPNQRPDPEEIPVKLEPDDEEIPEYDDRDLDREEDEEKEY
jgi:hypothetical protein